MSPKRAKGYIDSYRPHKRNLVIIEQVVGILAEYQDFLPLTLRQVFYRMVGLHGYPKDDLAAKRLYELLGKARRAGMIPFEAIRDDGAIQETGNWFSGPGEFWRTVKTTAERYSVDRQAGQRLFLELWVEAAGMVPQIVRVAGALRGSGLLRWGLRLDHGEVADRPAHHPT